MVDMGNTVLSKRVAGELHRYVAFQVICDSIHDQANRSDCSIKAKHPDIFLQVELFRKTLVILESHHFRLPARRFALDLFDKSVMRRVVLEDDFFSESDSE
jgi:rapamycin-insensitive companion of mTOR